MTEVGKIFDSLFRNIQTGSGGILQPVDADQKDLYDEWRTIAREIIIGLKELRPHHPDIYLDFVDDETLGAKARCYEGRFYIAVHSGTVMLIMDMFLKMFATRSILPTIGNSSQETDEEKKLSAGCYNNAVTFDIGLTEAAIPKDLQRQEYAHAYMIFAMQFLIYHEIGHILRGHTGLLDSLYPGLPWIEFEVSSFNKTDLGSDNRQTLEMDADSFAVNRFYNDAIVKAQFLHPEEFPYNEIYQNLSEFYKHWFFAIYSLFKLCGLSDYRMKETSKSNHPPPIVRLHCVFTNIVSLHQTNNIDSDTYGLQVAPTFMNVENAFSKITYQEPNPRLHLDMRDSNRLYLKKLLSNWNKLYDLLIPFAFEPLPPKNDG